MLRWIRYTLEWLVLRGSWALVLMLFLFLSSLAFSGAVVAYCLPGGNFANFGEAFWWAVLRISDTGYLSDDTTSLGIRALSVTLSILGMSVTVGGIVAIVSQSMHRWLTSLGTATTPVPFKDHVVLLGWTDRTPRLLDSLLSDFPGRVVLLLEEVGPMEVRRLARLGFSSRRMDRVVLRRGNATRQTDLRRAGIDDARCVILPASPGAILGHPEAGPRVLKTLLALRAVTCTDETPPDVVVELVDRTLIGLVEATYPGARVLHSDRVLARAFRLGLQSPGILSIAGDLVRPREGWLLQTTQLASDVGQSLASLSFRDPGNHLVGIARRVGTTTRLFIEASEQVRPGDVIVYLHAPPWPKGGEGGPTEQEVAELLSSSKKRILVLGWGEHVPDLISELRLEGPDHYEVDILSDVPLAGRERALSELNLDEGLRVRNVLGSAVQLGRDAGMDISCYDEFLVPAERANAAESSDLRTLAIVLALDRVRSEFKPEASICAEFLEPEELHLISGLDTLVSPYLTADVLASLALTPDTHEDLRRTLFLQSAYSSRVLHLPKGANWDLRTLATALRVKGTALLQPLPSTESGIRRIMVAEAARGPQLESQQDEFWDTGHAESSDPAHA